MKMIKVLTKDLTKNALNYAVAIATAGLNVAELEGHEGSICVGDANNQCIGVIRGVPVMEVLKYGYYDPSSNWAQGGPIIEREALEVEPERANKVNGLGAVTGWRVVHPKNYGGLIRYSCRGDTLLEAAMRCFVASKLGLEVEIPFELLTISDFTINVLNELWIDLGNIPTAFEGDDVDKIEEEFLHFPIGTHRETIWHWFESMNPAFSAGEKMSGK